MYKDEYFFPAMATQTQSGNYSVYFPDLPGCISGGNTLEEVARNINEALCLHLYGMEEDGDKIPEPSNIRNIVCDSGYFCLIAQADMKLYRKKRKNKYVNRVVTLPDWINEEAKRSGVNVSQILQEALKQQLGVR